MTYQELSPQGEALLKEIIGLQTSGKDNAAHWNERFQNLSFQEENLLRDTFRELRECGYIKTQWADNIPYYLAVTVDLLQLHRIPSGYPARRSNPRDFLRLNNSASHTHNPYR